VKEYLRTVGSKHEYVERVHVEEKEFNHFVFYLKKKLIYGLILKVFVVDPDPFLVRWTPKSGDRIGKRCWV